MQVLGKVIPHHTFCHVGRSVTEKFGKSFFALVLELYKS